MRLEIAYRGSLSKEHVMRKAFFESYRRTHESFKVRRPV